MAFLYETASRTSESFYYLRDVRGLVESASKISKNKLGEDHPKKTLHTLVHLASFFGRQPRYEMLGRKVLG